MAWIVQTKRLCRLAALFQPAMNVSPAPLTAAAMPERANPDAGNSGARPAVAVQRIIKINRDIADILGASQATVKKHLEHVYAKLGVETRTAAAGMAVDRIRQLHPQFEG